MIKALSGLLRRCLNDMINAIDGAFQNFHFHHIFPSIIFFIVFKNISLRLRSLMAALTN